jgi:hypothetical protein
MKNVCSRVADPHHLNGDPYPAIQFGVDSDPIFHFDADPAVDPIVHFDVDRYPALHQK